MKKITIYLLISLFLFSIPSYAHTDSNELALSGVVLDQGDNIALRRFTQWLAKHADYNLTPSYKESYQAITDDLTKHRKDLAWTCGAPFVEDYENIGQQLIAVPLFKGKPTYHSLVLVKKGRTEQSLVDFKGQVFAFSDPRSNSGFVAPSYTLKKQGIDINKYFRLMVHTSSHEGSIDAVLNNFVDVANVDEYILVQHFKAHPEDKDKLLVLEKFGPFPFTPIVAGSDTPKAVVERLQQALTTMHLDPEGAEILKLLGLDGFVVKPVSFYQPISAMLDDLKK